MVTGAGALGTYKDGIVHGVGVLMGAPVGLFEWLLEYDSRNDGVRRTRH